MKHQLHLRYPNSRLFLTSIPKNGCTTLKNFFQDIELKHLGKDTSQRDYGPDGMHVHVDRFRFRVSTGPRKDDSHSVLVLRNPYSRVASAWINKFLYAQGDYAIVNRHRNRAFAQLGEMSTQEIRKGFRAFVEELSCSNAFLESDNHWRPQSHFFRDLADYSIVLETTEIHKLPTILADRGVSKELLDSCNLHHFNKSESPVYDFLWSPGTAALVERAYSEDFFALGAARIEVSQPQERADHEIFTELSSADVARINRSRLQSADQLLRLTYESKSWRWTQQFRKLISYSQYLRWRLGAK